jgi:hypothetical protein
MVLPLVLYLALQSWLKSLLMLPSVGWLIYCEGSDTTEHNKSPAPGFLFITILIVYDVRLIQLK